MYLFTKICNTLNQKDTTGEQYDDQSLICDQALNAVLVLA